MEVHVYKAYYSYNPHCLSEMFKKQKDHYHKRKSNALVQPKGNSTRYGLHSFKYEEARMWNNLGLSCRSIKRAGRAQELKDALNGM